MSNFHYVVLVALSFFCCNDMVGSNNGHEFQSTNFLRSNDDSMVKRKEMKLKFLSAREIPNNSASDDCMQKLQEFSYATSTFVKCAVAYSHPLHYCINCVSQYLNVMSTYSLIFNDTVKNGCQEQLLRADTIQVSVMTYNFIQSVWSKSSCDQCFDTLSNGTIQYNVSDRTNKLLHLVNVTKTCFKDFAHFPGNGSSSNDTVCQKCKQLYCNANDYYEIAESDGSLCSDLIDAMNSTRHDWAQKHGCTNALKDRGPIWVITALVGVLPFVLYFGIYFYDKRRIARSTINDSNSQQGTDSM